ncbi:protein LDOC1-like [Bombina bombina]|nr:protein LDOC1-like [Bombina bombina]
MDPAGLISHVEALTLTVENLTKGMTALQTENTSLKQYINDKIDTLKVTLSTHEPQPNPPQPFSGNRNEFREFKNSCYLYFQLKPKTYPNDHLKVLTTISYLRGEPRIWANFFFETDDPILYSLEQFFKAMAQLYDDPFKQLSAETAMRSLR